MTAPSLKTVELKKASLFPCSLAMIRRQGILYLGTVFGVLLLGCGGNEPNAMGTITLDGQPLAEATVSFVPQDAQLESHFSSTDGEGRYVLDTPDGTPVPEGRYTVRITTFQPAIPEMEPPMPAVPERVPVKYNVQSELTVDITSESKPMDFALESDGFILQPREAY